MRDLKRYLTTGIPVRSCSAGALARAGTWHELPRGTADAPMLIPSIDLKDGQVVQLVQGRDLALASDDVFAWVKKFQGFPRCR